MADTLICSSCKTPTDPLDFSLKSPKQCRACVRDDQIEYSGYDQFDRAAEASRDEREEVEAQA